MDVGSFCVTLIVVFIGVELALNLFYQESPDGELTKDD